MSDVNGTLGAIAGEMVESLGQAWSMCHVTPGVRAMFGAYAKMRGMKEAQALDIMGVFQELCAAGAYNWGSPLDPTGMGSGIAAMLRQGEGRMYLIGLLLKKAHGELPAEKLVEVVAGNPEGFGLALAECMRLPGPPGQPDPNPEAPQAGATAPTA